MAFHQAGQLAEAEAIYRQILAAQPHHADALHLLGIIAHQTGHRDAALGLIRKAILGRPRAAMLHNSLGNVLQALGQRDEAIASADFAEGQAAFAAKRSPRFTGR